MLNDISEIITFYNSDEEFNLAISYTVEKTGFTAELIEKDYLCSAVLKYLYLDQTHLLVFKGGTLLAKTHADFYRLSEDLDFTIPILYTATRKQRSDQIKPIKKMLDSIETVLPIFKIKTELKGSNESRQYNMELAYQSKTSPKQGKIFIEIGLREELIQPTEKKAAKTLLIDPYSESIKVNPINIICLSLKEAYAEKIRAAFCRKKLAIRDFYDLDHALKNNIVDLNNDILVDLVKKKVKQETHFHDFADIEVINFLKNKIAGELQPTLKRSAMDDFNLENLIQKLLKLRDKINV